MYFWLGIPTRYFTCRPSELGVSTNFKLRHYPTMTPPRTEQAALVIDWRFELLTDKLPVNPRKSTTARRLQTTGDERIAIRNRIDVVQAEIIGIVDIFVRFITCKKSPAAVGRIIRRFAVKIAHLRTIHGNAVDSNTAAVTDRYWAKRRCVPKKRLRHSSFSTGGCTRVKSAAYVAGSQAQKLFTSSN